MRLPAISHQYSVFYGPWMCLTCEFWSTPIGLNGRTHTKSVMRRVRLTRLPFTNLISILKRQMRTLWPKLCFVCCCSAYLERAKRKKKVSSILPKVYNTWFSEKTIYRLIYSLSVFTYDPGSSSSYFGALNEIRFWCPHPTPPQPHYPISSVSSRPTQSTVKIWTTNMSHHTGFKTNKSRIREWRPATSTC